MGNKLNPKIVKYIFTSVLAAIASVLIIIISTSFSDKIISVYQKGYEETANLVAEGYAKLAEERIQGCKAVLEAFYDEELFTKGSETSIILHLSKMKDRLPPDFLNVFYFDTDGISTDLNGNIRAVKDREYYNAIVYSGAKSFVTGALDALLDGTLVFIVARAVYDSEGHVKGGLCGTVRLYSFARDFLEINLIDSYEITIVDKFGKFVVNKNQEKISQVFVPEDRELAKYGTENIAKMKSGSVIAHDPDGKPVSLIFRPINSAGWVLCLVIPAESMQESIHQRTIIKLLMILISLVVIFVLFFGELRLIDYFQREQLLYIDYDSVTGLWSQDRFEHEADRLIRRRGQNKYMLIDMDILGFKYIGQNHGGVELKKLLKFLAKEVEKAASLYQGICCHGSSDHFYLLFKISGVKNAMRVFKQHASAEISVTDNYRIPFTLKFGIAFVLPGEKYKGLTISSLMGQASIAQKNVRKDSSIIYSIYDVKFLHRIQDEYFLESQSEKALANREFFVLYQPKISLKNEKVIGAEALVRWKHPERGIIPPNDFIPLFERNGFVTKVDFFVYEEVLKFLDARIKAGLPVVQISVNMSRNHNKPEKFMQEFMEVFNRYDVPAKYIQVEILERSFSENRILAEITNLLHQRGFTVAMDDFGTGESSLSMLTQVPIDVLKFDRSFLLSSTNRNGEIDRHSAGFIESFIGLSKRLDKETVFEGVETESQRDFLRVIDCDSVQGYFYSKPLSQPDFEEFLKNNV